MILELEQSRTEQGRNGPISCERLFSKSLTIYVQNCVLLSIAAAKVAFGTKNLQSHFSVRVNWRLII